MSSNGRPPRARKPSKRRYVAPTVKRAGNLLSKHNPLWLAVTSPR